MITAAQDEIQSYQRLRRTINAKMWRWKVVSGWKWRSQGEHINSLELRAILACLRWRCEHLGEYNTRISLTRWYASTASPVDGHLPAGYAEPFAESTRFYWHTMSEPSGVMCILT